MAGKQKNFQGLVLKKTKLGESDLIITFLAQDGSRVQGVAKGARKPQSSFSARLELFSSVEVFCSETKGLPIIQEVRLQCSYEHLRVDYDLMACASAVAEFLYKAVQEDLPVQRLYDCVAMYFSVLQECPLQLAPALTAAALLKCFALLGLRPSFTHCVACEDEAVSSCEEQLAFSYVEGGVLCDSCKSFQDYVSYDKQSLLWLHALLMSTFRDIAALKVPMGASYFGLQLCQEWGRQHLGVNVKSIPILLTTFGYDLKESE